MGHYTPCFKFTLLKALLISTKPALHCILPQRKLVRSIHKHQIQLGAFGGWWFPQNIENTQTKPHQLFLAVKYSNMCVLDFHRRAQTSSNQNRTDMRTSVPKWARSQVSELRKRVSQLLSLPSSYSRNVLLNGTRKTCVSTCQSGDFSFQHSRL